jgi:hypothetical protein
MPPLNPEYDRNQPHVPIRVPFDFSDNSLGARSQQFGRISAQPHILQYGTVGAPSTVPALPSAAAGGLDSIIIPGAVGHQYWEMHQTTAQTLMPSRHATKGMEVALDQVDNETVQYVPGGNHAANPLGYQIPAAGGSGDAGGVIAEATLEITTVAGTDQLFLGFIKQEAFATPTALVNAGDPIYDTIAGLLMKSGDVFSLTDLNNSGAAVGTDTLFNWANAGIHKLAVRIYGRRVIYYINGKRVGDPIAFDGLGTAISSQNTRTPPAFSFDAGDFVVPILIIRQDAGLTPVYVRDARFGLMSEFGLSNSPQIS